MKHVIQKLDQETAVIAISSATVDAERIKPTIHRVYPTVLKSIGFAKGVVLDGSEVNKVAALILLVRTHDLFVIKEQHSPASPPYWLYYRVTDRFEPEILARDSRPLTEEELLPMIQVTVSGSGPLLNSSDELLRNFLCEKEHPEWLEQIIQRQVNRWRQAKSKKLFKLAPSFVRDSDISRGVNIAPFEMMAHLRDRLTPSQLQQCAEHSLEGAVMFAFDELSQAKVDEAIMKIPSIVMRFAAERINEEEFELCLFIHPFSAYQIRKDLPERRHAMALAAAHPYAFLDSYGDNLPSLQEEIVKSIGRYPVEWLAAHNQDYGRIFDLLQSSVDLEITPPLIGRLLNETPEDLRDSIATYCAGTF